MSAGRPFTVLEHERLDSTHSRALSDFSSLADGDVVTARRQDAGRGRFGRTWLSEGKGLYFTIVLKPAAPRPEVFPCYTHLLAVSVCAALERLGLSPSIKWPNDVLCGGGKIAGILAEAVVEGGRPVGAAVGAGINLSQDPADFAGLDRPAVSIAMLRGGAAPEPGGFLSAVLEEFFALRPALEERGFPAMAARYRGRAGFIGERVKIRSVSGEVLEGTADIDDAGLLVLYGPGGRVSAAGGEMDF
ncbi:MAG: biotin--[acetyl-CoA-carboxylase] ligase [Elusimicrobiales bacterium]|jgi:BirA family biotin operon repressor/biotin-[acetyl-CoA-carboxylase] ligase|nr:biotin--[acetyl-CoA-carboxylase] ligase [Elusimicrobiales bacterium]